jgi:hypothetical protein
MNFGLITEGVSEHNIIKYLVARFFRDDDPSFSSYVPKLTNGKQADTGGWHKVLEACESDDLETYLIENEYLIIQIDTDVSQTSPFNVSHRMIGSDGNEIDKPIEKLHEEVIEALRSRIPTAIWDSYKEKIHFAICIHSIECWLLPAVISDRHKSAINNCILKLNSALRQKNLLTISANNKNNPQSIKAYHNVLSFYKKQKAIKDASLNNYGFQKFIESLELIDTRTSN